MKKVKDPKMVAMGRRNRAAGARFERKTRKDLEDKGWTVVRWSNQMSLENEKVIPAKALFGMSTTGFPDFIAFKGQYSGKTGSVGYYEVIGVECKSNGYLKPEEKDKCQLYLDKKIFSSLYIARKGKIRGTIDYENFLTKYIRRNKMEDGLKGEVVTEETAPVEETTEEVIEEATEEVTEEVETEEPIEEVAEEVVEETVEE